MNEQPPQPDISQILGLLANMNKPAPDANAAPDTAGLLGALGALTNNNQTGTNDLLLKFLLNGGLQKLLTPKPKEPDPVRTINLDNYVRID
jgi:hypothetical protein